MATPLELVYDISANSYTLTLPLIGGTITTVNWGDGITETSDVRTHEYDVSGNYTVTVDGTGITQLSYATGNLATGNEYLTACNSFGEIGLTNLSYAFNGCILLTSVPTGPNSLPQDTDVVNMAGMFQGATAFNQDLSAWNVSTVENMSSMFQGATAFDNSGNSLEWASTFSVTDMSNMFNGAIAFNQDIHNWDVSSVTTMEGMFYGATIYNNGSVTNSGGTPLTWGNNTKVTNVTNMFRGAIAFNQDISTWDVSGVQIMNNMFQGATLFNNGDITNNGLKPLAWGNNFNVVTDMSNMFYGATAFNQDISSWDVSSVTDMSNMFQGAVAFNNGAAALTWGSSTSSVTTMAGMFLNASAFNQNIGGWNVSGVTNMSGMFQGATNYNNGGSDLIWGTGSSPFISYTSNVTDMSNMFNGASSFNQYINDWNVSNVTTMAGMFLNARAFNQNVGDWDVQNVANMTHIFDNTKISISNFNTILNTWSTLINLTRGVQFGVLGLTYTPTGLAGHNDLTNTFGWVILGDAFVPDNIKVYNTFTLTYHNTNITSSTSYSLFYRGNKASPTVTTPSSPTPPPTTLIFTDVLVTISGIVPIDLRSGTSVDSPLVATFTMNIQGICFKEGTKILTGNGYVPIENLKKGDLVKTLKHNYVPINMIGRAVIHNLSNQERTKERLYKCSKEQYPELTEDLVITGCHSILVDEFKEGEREKTAEVLGRIFVTDAKYRLPACVDERASIYDVPGAHTIYHIALDHDDYKMNYGIYANGLLVETCSKRHLKEVSKMELL